MRKSAVTVFAVLAAVFLFRLAAGTGESAQVGVYVEPERAFTGAAVKIFGYVKPEPRGAIVEITLFPPAPQKSLTREVAAAQDGSFAFLFNETTWPGTWTVRAAKKGTAQAASALFVITAGVFAEECAAGVTEVVDVTEEGFGEFRGALAGYPDFEGKDDMLRATNEILERAEEMTRHLAILRDAARRLEEQLRLHRDGLPHEVLQALEKAADDSNDAVEEIERRMPPIRSALESTRESAEWCHVWLGYYEFCELLGALNNFLVSKISEIGVNLGLAAAVHNLHPAVQQAIQTYFHLILTAKPSAIGFAGYMTGTLAALGSDVYGKLMQNCSYYKGTVEGDYRLELLHKGEPFYVMSYRLTGEMWLSFEARRPGDPAVYLRGRMRGRARDFKCDLSMEPFALPGTFAPAFCHCPVPPVSSRHFLLYFTGEATDNEMKLALEKVHSDFDLKSVGFYALISVHAVGLEADFLEFPLMDAEWFVTRATKISDPRNEDFTLNIKAEGDRSVAEETFVREISLPATPQRKAVRVNMTLKIKVCSPGC
ncbi:MAG: hypothetical protein JW747_03505 [Candidatus Aminicenantes bacterium]|nr:hypothetical protein [Candidatus Aminicenantes bacterium]